MLLLGGGHNGTTRRWAHAQCADHSKRAGRGDRHHGHRKGNPASFLDKLRRRFLDFEPRAKHGLGNVVEADQRPCTGGEAKVFVAMGGNFPLAQRARYLISPPKSALHVAI